MKNTKKTISGTFLLWLVLIMAITFVLSAVFSWAVQTHLADRSAETVLRLNIRDVRKGHLRCLE